MVNDPATDDLIHWSDEGDAFFGTILSNNVVRLALILMFSRAFCLSTQP